jgi:hypothetical protein
MTSKGLNGNHLRRLATSMTMVDAAASRILDFLDDPATGSRMTVVDKTSLGSHEQSAIRELVASLKTMAARFARKYGVAPQTRDLRRSINAQMSQVWTVLENTHARKMKGMGRVPEEVAEEIDADVDEMLALVKSILQALKPAG